MESVTKGPLVQSNKTAKNLSVPLRVLWFTTSPSLSRARLDGSYNVGTSWIEAMEDLVHQQTDIDLAIAFTWQCEKINSFKISGSRTTYYTIPRRPKGKLTNFIRKHLLKPEPSSVIPDYLEVVEDYKPDVINFFGTENPFPLIIPHIDIPNIIWFQGNLTVYHKKWHAGISLWSSLLSESLIDLLMARSDLHDFLLNYQFVKREKKIFNSATNFIGRTEWDKRLVSTMAPQANYYHCDEVMRSIFHSHQSNADENSEKYILVSTYRGNLYKGLETAMSAYQILSPILDKPLEWRIIGVPHDSHYYRVCSKVANMPKANHGLLALGNKSADEMITELEQAHVFVHPSHIDNSPNSLCEAMLMGLPIVSTNVGGIPNMLEDGKEGLLVQNGDPYAMAGAILQLLKDRHLANSLAKKARARALLRNDGSKIIDDLVAIYSEIRKKVKTESTK